MTKKFNYASIPSLPQSKNFSEYTETGEFDRSDDGLEEDRIFNQIEVEQTILKILTHFNDKQKVVFLYQLVRDSGYDITHEECAKTLSMGRVNYMNFLLEVRKRVKKFLQDKQA